MIYDRSLENDFIMITNTKTQIKTIRFSKTKLDFIQTLRERVNNYFTENKVEKHGNAGMVFKTIFMFTLFLVPYILMLLHVFTGPVSFFLLWVLMGFGMAGIGLSVMHDANHSSYSKNPRINKIISYSLNMLGGNTYLWKIQHNQLHHGFTNIEEIDEDIHAPKFLRFSPNSEKYPVQRHQHIYAWFFYGLSTLTWVTTKNFLQFYRYKNNGLIKESKEFRKEMFIEVVWKIIYYFFFLALPIIVLPVSAGLVIAAFFIMHFFLGFALTMVFQPAHVMPSSEYSMPDDNGNMENSWAIHQMLNTCNYAPKSKLFSWFIGGLNFQIEHHLFPNICHVHYKQLSEIVRRTSIEFGIPYNVQPSFIRAIHTHYQMLKYLGSTNMVQENVVSTDIRSLDKVASQPTNRF